MNNVQLLLDLGQKISDWRNLIDPKIKPNLDFEKLFIAWKKGKKDFQNFPDVDRCLR